MHARTWTPAISAAALLVACDARTVKVEPGTELTLDYAFSVILDREGKPSRVGSRFRVAMGQLERPSEPLRIAIDLDQERLALIGFDAAGGRAMHHGFDAARDGRVSLALGVAIPAGEVRREEGGEVLDLDPLARPGQVRVVMLESGDAPRFVDATAEERRALEGALVLTLPIDREYCRVPGKDALVSFGARVEGASIEELIRVDRRRALALDHDRGLFLLERGGTVRTASIGVATGGLRPSRRMALRMNELLLASSERIQLVELGERSLTLAGTASASRSPGVEFQDVAIDRSGRAIAVGPGGAVIVRDAPGTPFRRVELVDRAVEPAEVIATDLRRVFFTGLSEQPHLLGGDQGRILFLYSGDVSLGTVRREPIASNTGVSGAVEFRALGASTTGGTVDRWAVASSSMYSYLLRSGPGAPFLDVLDEIARQAPERSLSCLGALGRARQIRGAVFFEGSAYLLIDCFGAILRVKLDDYCTTIITVPGAPLSLAGASSEGLTAISIHEAERLLTVGAADGALYELEL